MELVITVTIPAASVDDLKTFGPVEGKWEVSDASFQHLVAEVAKAEACALTRGEIDADDLWVELFRGDGRSLDGSDGITSGSLLITRRA